MATLETKYSIGDAVFWATTTQERKKHPCPDCLGSRAWKAISPAGTEYEFSCPRCSASYNSDRDMMLDYTAHAPAVSRLTIGSVQFNTATGSYDSGARYMCHETGVGSGSVYSECDLFETHEQALECATAHAALLSAETPWIVKLYDKSLRISDYELANATVKLGKEAESRARSMLYGLGDLFGTIEEADDKDAILEAINDYRNFDWERDKAKASAA